MGAMSRRKGVRGEREVTLAFEAAGFEVRSLEATGDHLAIGPPRIGSPTLHLEAKRHERVRLPEWIRQAELEAPAGAFPVVVYRQSRSPWRVNLELEHFLRCTGAELAG
jgi:Holliday junction resolvase